MEYQIKICFNNNKIKNLINKLNELFIKKEFFNFKINKSKGYYALINCELKIRFDSLEKMNILNDIFDYFIECGCYYYDDDQELYIIYDYNKELYYKSVYWSLNSTIFYDCCRLTFKSLLLTHNDKFIRYAENLINNKFGHLMNIPIHKDLSLIEFICDKCKKNMSKEYYDSLINIFSKGIVHYKIEIINIHDVSLFEYLHKYEALELVISFFNLSQNERFIELCLILNKSNVLNY
jgi:hypothetical protein